MNWSGFRPLFDFWGNEIKRFYKLETLAGATEWMLRKGNDRFLIPSLQDVMGPAPVTSLSFDLFQEGKYQLIFRLRAANAKRKEAVFAFVAAKNEADFSTMAEAEHKNLRILHERAPVSVVKPFRGGRVYLPDRHHRAGHGREVYVYLTQWLGGFHELGITRDLQFFVNTLKPHTFTIAQTEELKQGIVEIIARTYDAAKRECMDIPEIASGDFVVSAPDRGTPKLKLIACRRMMRHMTPAKLIHRIVSASWDWGGREFRLVPGDPAMLTEGLVKALGKEQARTWFAQYRTAVRQGTFPEQDALPVEALDM